MDAIAQENQHNKEKKRKIQCTYRYYPYTKYLAPCVLTKSGVLVFYSILELQNQPVLAGPLFQEGSKYEWLRTGLVYEIWNASKVQRSSILPRVKPSFRTL